ncbi:MAG: glycosyl hydrolase family 65 protein [Candidatus Izemoplasma sp.]|nr:glycosyl hydrolase family 65 protein [Candidatus Izemoplasma sp.]
MIKTYKDITEQNLLIDESLFSTANRRFGVRGALAEGVKSHFNTYRDCLINGVYETYPYTYGEKGKGYPDNGQFIIALPDIQTIYIKVAGDILNLDHANITSMTRVFDTTTGKVSRQTTYQKDTFIFHVKETRITPFDHPNLYIAKYTVETENYDGQIELVSTINNKRRKNEHVHDPRFHESNQLTHTFELIDDNTVKTSTIHTNFHIYFGMYHSCEMTYEQSQEGELLTAKKYHHLTKDSPVSVTKYVVITSSIYETNPYSENKKMLNILPNKSIDDYSNTVTQSIFIKDNTVITEALNYNLYQLYASGPSDNYHSIPAKGLSGKGYEGHYFWDSEMYMFPYFLLTAPKEAKALLLFRYNTLDKARQEAKKLNHSIGVKFPWRTINGDEVSPYFPAGTAQYHINAIIAIQFLNYYFVTDDEEFLLKKGFEVIYKTALVYLEIGHFHDGKFHINNVTGPDEYTAIVNNNYYTNSLAKYHIEALIKVYNTHKDKIDIQVNKNHLKRLKEAAEKMVIPYNATVDINPQDEAFMQKKKLNLETAKRPLLLHMHPLTIYRHQVCKQADTILSHMLLNNEKRSTMYNSLKYYQDITIHDSSLSKCIFSVMNSRIGDLDTGYAYFKQQLMTDLNNAHKNTQHGLHIANMGGTYLTVVYGFLGLHISEGGISLAPKLPGDIKEYDVSLIYKGAHITISVKENISIKTDKEISLDIYGQKYVISNETRLKLSSNA